MTSRRATRRAHPARLPYDNSPHADRWWGRLSPQEVSAAADADPLRFVADHLSLGDRHEGCLVLHGDLGPGLQPTTVIIGDAPVDPSIEECCMAAITFISALGQIREHLGADALRIGVLHHRTGPSSVTDLDRRWLLALEALAPEFGYEVLGVLARTERGALVAVVDTNPG